MTKIGTQRKKRRRCIFCPSDNVSKEHVWSTWLHPHLKGNWSDSYTEYFHHQANNRAVPVARERSRQGHTATLKVRAPCRSCNSGWMNRIEGEARPFLTPLVEGRPVTLLPGAVEAIAKWITLKAIVCEHMGIEEYVTPRADRFEFAEHQTIPRYFRAYVAYHLDPSWGGSLHRNCANLRRSDVPPDGLSPRSIQVWSLGVGALFICVVASRYVEPEEVFVHNDYGLFPAILPIVPDRQLRWPPLRPLTHEELERNANALEHVFKNDARIRSGDILQFGE